MKKGVLVLMIATIMSLIYVSDGFAFTTVSEGQSYGRKARPAGKKEPITAVPVQRKQERDNRSSMHDNSIEQGSDIGHSNVPGKGKSYHAR